MYLKENCFLLENITELMKNNNPVEKYIPEKKNKPSSKEKEKKD